MSILGSAIRLSEAFNSGLVENGMWEELEGGAAFLNYIFTDLSISLTYIFEFSSLKGRKQ